MAEILLSLADETPGTISLGLKESAHPHAVTSTSNGYSVAYDAAGNLICRVAMQSTVNGTTTLTSYIGSIEEVQSSGSSTQTTTY